MFENSEKKLIKELGVLLYRLLSENYLTHI